MTRQIVPFTWLLSADSEMPEWARQRLASLLQGLDHVILQCHEALPHTKFIEKDADNGRVIMTRLDSDDGLHPEYLATVRDVAGSFTGVVDLTYGAVVHHPTQRGKWITRRGTPFVSLVEESRPLRGVWCASHRRLANKIGKVKVVEGGPPWFAVTHEYNHWRRGWRRGRLRVPWDVMSKVFQ
jgi:hypothetical protein